MSRVGGMLCGLLCALTMSCGPEDRSVLDAASAATVPVPVTPPAATATAIAAEPSASAAPPAPAADTWLDTTLRAADPRWADWLADAPNLRLQILVTIVTPEGTFESHELRADAEYFYPASAIKTLLAISALRTLSQKIGSDVNLATKIERCREDRPGCEPPEEDEDDKERRADGKKKHEKLRVGEEISKMLSYSDNDSYNRLYDIVGHRELNEDMAKLGLASVRFHHRMSAPADQSRTTLRTVLLPPGKKPITIPKRKSDFEPAPTPATNLLVGTAYKDRKGLVEEPLSFATKNYVSLHDLQRVNVSLLFPGRPEGIDLGLSEAQRKHIVSAMTQNLRAQKRAAEHGPLSPGLLEVLPADRLVYIAKSGRAYGFHLENAFIKDTESGRGFFVTATVYSNPDGVLNDDDYGYDEVTRPLLASLGQALGRAILAPTTERANEAP
ncbi:MAG: hypothetical protein HOW73_33430 [Polyangiaceae bacterium]|nr:hypothetical protein [Polyangiaceae bacterium]